MAHETRQILEVAPEVVEVVAAPADIWEPRQGADWEGDDLSAARGIATGVALGAAMWCAIGLEELKQRVPVK